VNSANVISGAATETTTQYATPLSFRLCGANVAPASTTLASPTTGAQFISATYTTTAGVATIPVPLVWNVPSFGLTCYSGTDLFLVSWTQDSSASPSSLFLLLSDVF